jgi:hypothetical protein
MVYRPVCQVTKLIMMMMLPPPPPPLLLLLLLLLFFQEPRIGIATDYGLDGRGVGVQVPVGGKIFLLSTSSRPVLGPTQPPIQWVPGALSQR